LSLLAKVVIAPSSNQAWSIRRGIQSEVELPLFAHHHQNCLKKKKKKAKLAMKYQMKAGMAILQ